MSQGSNSPPKGAGPGRPKTPRSPDDPSGRVNFDDRGNAVWEWAISTGAFGRDVSTDQLRRLEHPDLAILDESPPAPQGVRPNPRGAVRGYDPYDSGHLDKRRAPKPKKDLRKLSEWIALRRRVATGKDGGGR